MNFALTETQKAYLAGIIDGEGCITLRRAHKKRSGTTQYSLQLVISTTSIKLRAWLETIFRLKPHIWNPQLKDIHPNWRLQYAFHLNGAPASSLLSIVLPYLVIKREQAQLGVDMCETKGFHQGIPLSQETIEIMEEMYQEMCSLNHSDCILLSELKGVG